MIAARSAAFGQCVTRALRRCHRLGIFESLRLRGKPFSMIIRILTVLCLLLACTAHAGAQQWPQRPVSIIVGFAPGGNTDSIARLTAEWLRPRLGQGVVIE